MLSQLSFVEICLAICFVPMQIYSRHLSCYIKRNHVYRIKGYFVFHWIQEILTKLHVCMLIIIWPISSRKVGHLGIPLLSVLCLSRSAPIHALQLYIHVVLELPLSLFPSTIHCNISQQLVHVSVFHLHITSFPSVS